jgi:hypothetical protein
MGKKKDAALHGLSKAERKALEERERQLAAELAKREAKAAKKAKKKAKAEPRPLTAEEREALSPTKSAKVKVIDAALNVMADSNASDGARKAAETAAEAATEAGPEETDEQIKARIAAKRAERAAETFPRGGVTSTLDALNAIAEKAAGVAKKAAAIAQVETERGREFVAEPVPGDGGEAIEEAAVERAIDEFAKPSEAPSRFEDNTNGLGQYKVKRPADGKEVGYTRVTTYIDTLEDKTNLTKWKLRMLLEGVAVNDVNLDPGAEVVVATMNNLLHRRDLAIAKARKADRKGKLAPGQLATIVDAAWSEFKKAANALAEELLDLGGAHEKAQKGTDIHALCELADREGIDAVGELLTEGKITPADLADVEGYQAACRAAGIRIIPELIEKVVVIDDLKVAGRLDRGVYMTLPGMQRATKMVADIKTGNVELGTGKIAQQLELYSRGEGYDPETGAREPLKLSRTKAVLVHVPVGVGKATVHVVDLTLGRKGNALSGEVRAFRNEGKRAIDLKTDLAKLEG